MRRERALVAVGLDHTTAAIELRQRVAFPDEGVAAALAQLTDPARPLLEQAAILLDLQSRRAVRRGGDARPHELAAFLAHYHGVD